MAITVGICSLGSRPGDPAGVKGKLQPLSNEVKSNEVRSDARNDNLVHPWV
jgi:hypothetical protein